MLIFVPNISPRHHYVFKHVFKEYLGCSYALTISPDEFLAFHGPRINYSSILTGQGFQVIPSGLLEEENVLPGLSPPQGKWNDETILFPQVNGSFPFDLFSMVFYLLSRYEEFESTRTDEHGRFLSDASIAYKTKNIQRPWLDIVLEKFRTELHRSFPDLVFKKHTFQYIPTIDIDMAYCYKGKPWWRTLLATGKDVVKGNFPVIALRNSVLSGSEQDPYDVYDLITQLHAENKVRYFFLLGDYTTKDKNLPWQGVAMKKLVQAVQKAALTGIHPSYFSSEQPALFQTEIKRLEQLSGEPVEHSRQHFLRMKFHTTCLHLINCGIKHEYSMGYAEIAGFRASTARSFYFFDLNNNKETSLLIHPFMVMDVTLKDYMGMNPAEAMNYISEIISQVKRVNGELISLWHNESLSDYANWKGWSAVYKHLIKETKQ